MTNPTDGFVVGENLHIKDWREKHRGQAGSPILGFRLGLDIDGTITAAPKRFEEIVKVCRLHGGEVHIVTARPAFGRGETVEELCGYGIQFDALYFLPELSIAKRDCPHEEMDWFQQYLWQKVAYAKRHSLGYFIDSEPQVISLFTQFAPEIVATSAIERVKVNDPLWEAAVNIALQRKHITISLLQRHLKIGYGRAMALVQVMTDFGLILPPDEDGLRITAARFTEIDQLNTPRIDALSICTRE